MPTVNLPARYRLLNRIGVGAFGEVYLAEDSVLKKNIAVKIFRGGKNLSSSEFKILSRLHHPNIVDVYDFGLIGDGGYFTQEYIDGGDVISASHSWDQNKKLEIIADIAGALYYLHSQGVRHGDIKPSNILITRDGIVKLVDFGMAGLRKGTGLSGTPAYMSPEQIDGRVPDERSDVYSFGVVAYELLAGKNPFLGKNVAETLARHRKFRPHTEGLPRVVSLLFQKLLEKNPDARLQGADEIIVLLERAGGKTPKLHLTRPDPLTGELLAETVNAFGCEKRLILAGFAGSNGASHSAREISAEHQIAGRHVWRWSTCSNTNIIDVITAHTHVEKMSSTEDRWQVYEFCADKIQKCAASKGILLICEEMQSAGKYAIDFFKYLAKMKLKNVVIVCIYKQANKYSEIFSSFIEDTSDDSVTLSSKITLSPKEKVKKVENEVGRRPPALLHVAAVNAMNVHDYEGAVAFLERELEIIGHRKADGDFYEMLAEAATRSANYSLALKMLSQCRTDTFSILIKRSAILSQMGRLKEAGDILRSIKPDGHHEEVVLKDRQFKLLIREGRYEDVVNEKVLVKDAVLQNTIGLAYYYLGRYRDAEKYFKISSKAGGVKKASSKNLLGMVSYNLGDYKDAAKKYNEALKLYAFLSHPVGRLASMMNLAAVYHVSGEYKNAIKFYKDAVQLSKIIGQSMQEANLHNNLANLYVTINSLHDAEAELSIAKKIADSRGLKLMQGYNALIFADIAFALGDADAAKKNLALAGSVFEDQKTMRELCLVNISKAKAEEKDMKKALAYLKTAEGLATRHGLAGQIDSISLARIEILIKSGEVGKSEIPVLESIIKKNISKELEWEAWSILGTLRERFSVENVHAAYQKANDIVLWLASQLPMDMRERYLKEPRRAKVMLKARSADQPEGDMQISSLKRLLDINKKITTELSTEKVLTSIMDSVVELTGAERGFLVLKGKKDEFNVSIARNIDAEDIKKPKFKISRSIAERVLRRGEPVITTDALADSRFAAAESVHAMKLRSVICVPMSHRCETIGVIYVDNRYQAGMFDEDDIEVLTAFADQAAIAYINAKLYEEREASAKKIEELNQRLESVVARQALEIENISEDLELKQKDLELKYQYKNIIGKSPAMQAIFQVLDRITDTDSNVLITGESGTGKELVARAIHYNGPRKERAFVSVNCSAIPSTLLESELFGHRKGSFTGAIADKVGLFEQATGGTIFLDEIGDMPFEMQAKLLRAIQEGEIRRVGSNQHIKVDARVVAATNRDLTRLVAEKKFREDLFYRLNVLPVRLPSLRDRREDIPALIDHFLEKYSRGMKKREIGKDAIRLLINYQWPGNVRELENEIERAVVLSSEKITTPDLSENVISEMKAYQKVSTSIGSGGMKGIKNVQAEMERRMIVDAIDGAGGNKAKAAKLLEISRYGLYKKLEKYKIR